MLRLVASLFLTQRVVDSAGARIFERIVAPPASKRAMLSDGYILKFEFWANLQDFRQLGRNGQVGRDRLCSRLGDAIVHEIQLLQLASLVLTQRVADSDGALISEPIVAQPASKRATLSDGYILKFEFWANLQDFCQLGADARL